MQILPFALFQATEPFLGRRIAVLAVCIAVGIWMIWVGRFNIRTREAEETGKRALLMTLWGKSTTISGRWAVVTGWVRVVAGVAIIGFGFALFFFPEYFKK